MLRDSGSVADHAPAATSAGSAGSAGSDRSADVDELYARLKVLRKALAAARRVPAYVVFSAATLLKIAEQRPRSDEALLAVPGIGPAKLELYGRALLEAVAAAPAS